jgi:diguanylate cyclase (GGDEF)-like protein
MKSVDQPAVDWRLGPSSGGRHGYAAWQWVLVIGIIAIGAYFALPGAAAKDAAYSAIGIASVGGVLLAVRIRDQAGRRSWDLIAAGNLCFVLGDGVYDVYQFVLHRAVPFPSLADALYLAGYPFIFWGVLRLTSVAGRPGARESYADAGIVSIGALALSWHFLVGADAHASTAHMFAKLVTVAYPMMDIAVLFIVVRGLLFGDCRTTGHKLLAGSLLSMLIGDFIYDLLTLHGGYSTGNPVDAGWLIAYVLVAVAALHPSIAERGADLRVSPAVERRRLPAVAAGAFVAPAILLFSDLFGSPTDVAVLSGLSLALAALVTLRMRWLFARLSGQADALASALSARGVLEADLRHQAFHDALTGLANRALLYDRVEHALAGAPRASGVVALCLCDLDGFKLVNDNLGHPVGDEVLIAVGSRLSSIVRPGDTVARLGGDEFAILMENIGDVSFAEGVAERIISALRKPMDVGGREITLSASAGLAVADRQTTTEQLLSEADSAMYAAKQAGKNRFEIFEQTMRDRVAEHLALKSGFVGALERSEFLLEYQPQLSLRDGRLLGFEALLRWRHPTLGLVAPDRFISLAEESGHIVPIGRWVLETACEQAAQWCARFDTRLTIAVNVAGRQLQHPNFVDDVATALAISGLGAEQLIIEITENVLMAENEITAAARERLRATEVRLGIEGYSSLSHLRRYPIDVLKIDRLFIEGLVGDEPTEAIISAILSVGRSLGFSVIAEGVETEAQVVELRRLGCEMAQGFYFSRALPADECWALLEHAVRPAMS